jgi:glycosyltransferase involved in cell wall biosynthesis
MGHTARVCIGIPVYNGQRYLPQAIESILSQSFEDLEIIISDNASTDETGEICRGFAAKDKRIKYERLTTNIGAILNYARTYKRSSGQYFKWAAHDDLCEPTFIERCVEALDADPSAVLAYPKAKFIDSQGNYIKDYNVKLPTDSNVPSVRFRAIATAHHRTTNNLEIFGLMRRSAIDMIPQQGTYAGSDRVFLARLALYGRFVEVPEVLFLSRDHPDQSIHTLPQYMKKKKSLVTRFVGHGQLPPAEWFDPKYTGKLTFPEWRLMGEYLSSTKYGWLNFRERSLCVAAVARRQIGHGNWARMVRDFILAGDKLMARVVQSLHESSSPEAAEELESAKVA